VTLEEAEAAVAAFRARHPAIIAMWEKLNKELVVAAFDRGCENDRSAHSVQWQKEMWPSQQQVKRMDEQMDVYATMFNIGNDRRFQIVSDMKFLIVRACMESPWDAVMPKPPKNKPHYRQMSRKKW